MRLFTVLAAALAIPMPVAAKDHGKPVAAETATSSSLESVLSDPRRTADRARDEARHPAETLAFFKIEPGQTVVDVIPGSGWYTRILAPFLAGNGRYIALNPDVSRASEQAQKYLGNLAASFPAKAAGWTGQPESEFPAFNSDGLPASLDGSVDRILVFREMHNLLRMGLMHGELTTWRRLLKDDGMVGIVQHRAPRAAPASYTDGNKGYMREKDIIALMDLHGFELIAQSDVNANPADTADYPEGVWELPPALRTKRDTLKAVGESDRMTLLFRKRP